MNFYENLQTLRKNRAMTQEQLAERLDVSRQAVSKWESGQSYPEMDKLIQLCELFDCDLNTLVSGAVGSAEGESAAAYDQHKNSFAKAMAFGVTLLLLGVSAMLFLMPLLPVALAVVVLLLCATVAISVFIVYGIRDEHFREDHPVIEDFYTKAQRRQMKNKFTAGTTVGVGLILVGVILMVALTTFALAPTIPYAVLALFVSAGVGVLTYYGILQDKFNIGEYNKQTPKANEETPQSPADRYSGAIMLSAIAAFLVMGLVFRLWHPGWVIFPVAALLCGIVSTLQKKGTGNPPGQK
ncbi:MAG: helix-turn-helix domain-containing protein [Christensenellales bacterium]